MGELIRPPFAYIGAKTRFLDWIYSFFPHHTTFVDVFGGSGVVTFNKVPSKNDVYNDLNGRIVNFYSVLRDVYMRQVLAELISLTPYSREEFKACKEPSDEPVEDARRFYVKQNMSFSACGHSFGYVRGDATSKHTTFYELDWGGVIKRMQTITFENLPFDRMFENYDSPSTLFYCDPPYIETYGTNEYTGEWGRKEQDRLIDVLRNAKGYVVMSSYEHESLDRLLKEGWQLEKKEVSCAYKNSVDGLGKVDTKRVECLYINPRVVSDVKNRFLFK